MMLEQSLEVYFVIVWNPIYLQVRVLLFRSFIIFSQPKKKTTSRRLGI